MPLISPITTTKTRPSRSAQPRSTPELVVSDSTQETETTMVAIKARSMPRAITTSPMARPRIPRIDTLRTSAMMFPEVRKLGKARGKDHTHGDGQREHDAFLCQPDPRHPVLPKRDLACLDRRRLSRAAQAGDSRRLTACDTSPFTIVNFDRPAKAMRGITVMMGAALGWRGRRSREAVILAGSGMSMPRSGRTSSWRMRLRREMH